MTSRRPSTEQPPKGGPRRSARGTQRREPAAKPTSGFVPLSVLTRSPTDPETALDEIRSLYFNTTKPTIEADLAHAIELLKSLPSEAAREKATVYMDGLAQMRRDWARKNRT